MIEAYSDRSLNYAAAHQRMVRVAGLPFDGAPPQRVNRRRVMKNEDLNCGAAGVVLSGWACHHRTTENGERHIFGVLLPGDIVCTDRDGAATMTRVAALSPLEIADLDGAEGVERIAARAERRLTEARYLDQMVRLGGLSALRATGHLVLDLHDRLSSVGLARNGRFHMPIGQRVVASILGLSAVHVNRTLQQLGREGLVASGAGWMSISDRPGLVQLVACPTAFGHLSAAAGLAGPEGEKAEGLNAASARKAS